MSKIIKNTGYRELSQIVQVGNELYYVDSNNTIDKGYETMVFRCDANHNVTSWLELYCERYSTEDDMRNRHHYICRNLECYI